ncbi:hypothetical protein D3C75_1267320 [compost metagenome]
MVTLEHKGLGEDRTVFAGKGQRNTQFILAISQREGILRRLKQRTLAVCRVIRAVSACQAALCLVDE